MRTVLAALALSLVAASPLAAADRPNFLWIVAEDMSPDLGCYGDPYARTPNLDRFASQGARFTRAFTHTPVCAPSRSGLVTGMYPTTIGTHHMRSKLIAPPRTFLRHLQDAGYYVSWRGKTDFNFDVPEGEFDARGDWRRDRPAGKPFFAYVNLNQSHESQVRLEPAQFANVTRKLRPEDRHDPARAVLPPYYPDAPEVRRDWANYHDLVTAVDYEVGEILAELQRQGLAESTIVFFFGDHGRGLPRGKRWPYDSGIRVPLMVRWPGTTRPGSVRDDIVAFVDFAPTILDLAGVKVPDAMQGHPFLGPRARERKYAFSTRDRMDETYDRIRSVRGKRYHYIRNFHPELPYAQRISYLELMPTMQAWRRLAAEGKLSGAAKLFFAPAKPAEELYDTESDPHEVRNLAERPEHRKLLAEMRKALDDWIAETRDMGSVPETEMIRKGLVRDILSTYEERKRTDVR